MRCAFVGFCWVLNGLFSRFFGRFFYGQTRIHWCCKGGDSSLCWGTCSRWEGIFFTIHKEMIGISSRFVYWSALCRHNIKQLCRPVVFFIVHALCEHILKSAIHPLDDRVRLKSKGSGTCFLNLRGSHEQFENRWLKFPALVALDATWISEAANSMLEQHIGCGRRCLIRKRYGIVPIREGRTN